MMGRFQAPVLELEVTAGLTLCAVTFVVRVDFFAEVLRIREEQFDVVGVKPGAELGSAPARRSSYLV